MWGIKAQDKGKAPDILALSYHEDILTQSKRQMQRIEEHYNELKNQLRSLQNAKNELAKSQPYKVQRLTSTFYYFRLLLDGEKKIYALEKIADTLWKDIRNTEYMSRCIRGWENTRKGESLLDDEDLKL
ncbi:26253_t:CDS:2, partial [Gigaspora rosea]